MSFLFIGIIGGPKNEDTLIKMIEFFQENHSEIERDFERLSKILK